MTLKCTFRYISIAKIGNSDYENEDSILVPHFHTNPSDSLIRFAISDGATESSFSKEWSNILAGGYLEMSFEPPELTNTINTLADSWLSKTSVFDLPWFAQEKWQNGAFATFLGITLSLTHQNYESVAIGDCTLFHLRQNTLIHTFPISSSDLFNNTPSLISTNPKYRTDLENTVKYDKGQLLDGDALLLASDALAMWIFNKVTRGEAPWPALDILLKSENSKHDFLNWSVDKITNKEMKNDDISLVLINFD
jgi:hypothetical protein